VSFNDTLSVADVIKRRILYQYLIVREEIWRFLGTKR